MVGKDLNHWRSLNYPASDAQEMLGPYMVIEIIESFFYSSWASGSDALRRRQNGDTSLFFLS